MRLHHVQVACPVGGEDDARRFYGSGLGLTEVAKPTDLAGRGGCWFRGESAELHIGVEEPFTPARKAHPGLLASSVAELELLGVRLEELGYAVDWSQRHTFRGFERFHTFDGAGIEWRCRRCRPQWAP